MWVANSTLTLTSEVRIEVTALESGWSARLMKPAEDVSWVATILENPFEVRFSDGSAFAVGISGPDEDGALVLWDWEQEATAPNSVPGAARP